MILTLSKILAEIQFDPQLDEFQLNPHAIDLRVDESYMILPGEHLIVRSMEKVTFPDDVVGVVYPRSSLNRSNVTLDMTGIIDAGYSGQLILPLTNHSGLNFVLHRGQRIASVVFHRLENPVTPRLSKYHDSDGKLVADKKEELAFIEMGNIDGLKARFSI